MRFKQRVKLEEQYQNWRKKNHAKDCAFSVITFLDIVGVIAPRWIPADIHPENDVSVLTVDKDGVYSIDTYDGNDWFNFPGDVVAWMPIPEWEGDK